MTEPPPKPTHYRLRLDYPPSLNNLYSTTKTGRRVLTEVGRHYHRTVGYQAKQQGAREPIEGPIAVALDFFPPKHRNNVVADGDNLSKALFDGLKGIAWVDDRQVYRCEWERHAPVPPAEARTEVVIAARDVAGVLLSLSHSRALHAPFNSEITAVLFELPEEETP